MWCTCSRDSGSNYLFSLSLVCSYPYSRINLALFLEGRGGEICFRQSLAKDGVARSHVLHTVMKLDAFLINKDKDFMQLPTRIYLQLLSKLVQRTASDKTASPLKPLVLFIERFPCPSV